MNYERIKIISIEEVFAAIREDRNFIFANRPCEVSGVRILTYFTHGTNCVCDGCEVKGSFFAAERQINHESGVPFHNKFHLNFYGYDNNRNEVMMTSDHRIPKSIGGHRTALSNRQPMCSPHNSKKGNRLIYT